MPGSEANSLTAFSSVLEGYSVKLIPVGTFWTKLSQISLKHNLIWIFSTEYFLLILHIKFMKYDTISDIGAVSDLYGIIVFVTWITARKANNQSFYLGNKISPWYVVAYGMIGASLSGVTFMSTPGWVADTQFSYMVVVFGFFFGYIVIALILLPLYYRLKLTSIYTYLEQRFGYYSYKTGSAFFIISRILGASLRMFLVIYVLQLFVFDAWNVPFWVNVLIFIILIILYTLKGGVRTIIWTDTFQTTFMLLAVIMTVVFISKELGFSIGELVKQVSKSPDSRIFITDWNNERHLSSSFSAGCLSPL